MKNVIFRVKIFAHLRVRLNKCKNILIKWFNLRSKLRKIYSKEPSQMNVNLIRASVIEGPFPTC